jgi:hypothetical protein
MPKVMVQDVTGVQRGSVAFLSEIPVIKDGREQQGEKRIHYHDGTFKVDVKDIPVIVVAGCRSRKEKEDAIRLNRGPKFAVIGPAG